MRIKYKKVMMRTSGYCLRAKVGKEGREFSMSCHVTSCHVESLHLRKKEAEALALSRKLAAVLTALPTTLLL